MRSSLTAITEIKYRQKVLSLSKSKSFRQETVNFTDIQENQLISELESINMTRFIKKYGSRWRWAMLVHLMELFKQIDVQDVDLERLMFTTSFKEETDSEEIIEKFFQVFHNLVNKSCLVKTSVTPLISSENDTEKRREYLIRMH